MERQIPIYFDSLVIDAPIQETINSTQPIYRMKVRVFSKYANRNGSYITDAVADQLIASATQGTTPVIGFFDPETKTWASHTGPTLAKAYGYVESFLGWEPFEDTDGVTRDYAVFSIIVFADYYEEANNIFGQNQSMELDQKSISGDWALINDDYYYVYTTAKMAGFCIIGAHEPCFSVSAFFSQNEDTLNKQYEKFSSLLFELKAQVEEAKQIKKGGEQPMNEFEETTVVEEEKTPEVEVVEEETPEIEEPVASEFEVAEEVQSEEKVEEEEVVEPQVEVEEVSEPTEYELLQQQYQELQAKFDAATAQIEELTNSLASAKSEFENANAQIELLKASVTEYENAAKEAELENKKALIENYKKLISEEEISEYASKLNDLSYDELESKLAVCFAKKQMAGSEPKVVPLPESKNNEFALLMEKYRKN